MIRQRATRLTSAPFRVQAPGLVCGQLYERQPSWRVWSCAVAFLSPFGCRRSLVGRPVPATGIRFPHGRPTGGWSCPLDRDGVSMFHTGETRPVSGAPYTPGPWCSHGRHRNFGHHCHLPAAGPVLRYHFPSPKFWLTRLTGVHVIRPSGLPLACNRWMEHRSLGFLPGFTPRRYQRRMPGAGTSVEHSLGANRRSFNPPFRLSHSHSATSCRTSICQWPRMMAASSSGRAWWVSRSVIA